MHVPAPKEVFALVWHLGCPRRTGTEKGARRGGTAMDGRINSSVRPRWSRGRPEAAAVPATCGRLVAVLVSVVSVEGEQARPAHVVRNLGAHVGGGDGRGAEVDAAPHARVFDLLDRR
jgi:hypothetical protein